MGQNGTNWDRVHTVSLGSMGETENWVEKWRKQEKQGKFGKICDGKLEKK